MPPAPPPQLLGGALTLPPLGVCMARHTAAAPRRARDTPALPSRCSCLRTPPGLPALPWPGLAAGLLPPAGESGSTTLGRGLAGDPPASARHAARPERALAGREGLLNPIM